MKPTNKPPSVYVKLREKLGREPSNSELLDAGLEHNAVIRRQGARRAKRRQAVEAATRIRQSDWERT